MADEVIRLLQITDMHLQDNPETEMRGVSPEKRFKQVISQISSEPADCLLLTGDLTHHASSAYQRLSDELQKLPFPSFWIPGNHDLSGEMFKFSKYGYGRKVIEQRNWRILMLDSTAEPDGMGGGSLSEPELEFLKAELEAAEDDVHLLIVLHHHPISVQSAWQDSIMLGNADQFWSILDSSDQVRGVIFGHVHQEWALTRGAVKLFSAPASAPQFKVGTDKPEKEDHAALAGPAYGAYNLFPDGNVQAQIKRLKA